MNEIIESLCRRKSVRVFEDRAIPEDMKTLILESTMQAPSAGCQQLYTILDITDQELKDKLAESCDHQPFIAKAPMVLVFCADCKKWYDAYLEAGCEPRTPGVGDLMLAVTDTAIAAQNAVVAAESLGIGSCYIGDIMENYEEQRSLLQLPEYVFPAVMLVFGWPTEQQIQREKPGRCELKHIVHENTYRSMDGQELREMFAYKHKNNTYEEWCSAFCNRKYNSDFSKEMTRSVEKYLESFKNRGGYLFVHFTSEKEDGEQIYFAVSRDGLHWKDLNDSKPVLRSHVGEMGVRDPFLIRSVDGDKFYLIATDLRIAAGKGWDAAQYEGSRSVVVWESTDLVHWSDERMVEIGIEGAGCVWAPEAIYDETRQKYMMFWASMVKEEGEENAKQRIYCAYTEDFRSFTKPMKYIEAADHVIDTTIIRDGEYYYRFSKNETTKVIQADRGKNLLNGPFEKVTCSELEKIYGVEGPEIFKLNDSNKWCLIVDRFATQSGYMPLIADNLEQSNFKIVSDADYDMGKNKKRHGGVINITDAELERLLKRM